MDSGDNGLYLLYSSNNTIIGNSITNSTHDGIYLLLMASNNRIIGNNVTMSGDSGIHLSGGIYPSSNNLIYHNNFINNTKQATSEGGSINTWDDGYPSGGNYWSDYTDQDLYSGPLQNEAGSDEIWDHPYVIDENNRDHYPLTNPWPPVICTVYFYTDPAGPGFNINFKGQTYLDGDANTFLNGTSGPAKANAPPGYAFDHWETEGNVEVSNVMANPTNVTVRCGGNLTAVFRQIPTYTVTIRTSGLTSPSYTTHIYVDGVDQGAPYLWDGQPREFIFAEGETHTITVAQYVQGGAGTRYHCEANSWTTTSSGNQNHTFTYITQHLLTVATNPSGLKPAPTVTPPDLWHNVNTKVTCTAQEVAGYKFSHWTIDGVGQGAGINPITITMDAPHTAIAHYTKPTLPVGGVVIPVSKLELLAPWIGLGIGLCSIPGVVIATLLIRRRRRKA